MNSKLRRGASIICFSIAIMSLSITNISIILPLIIGSIGAIICFNTSQTQPQNLEQIIKQQKNISYSAHINRYFTFLSEAEHNRKQGEHLLAVKKYWQAIKTGESTEQWQEFGPPSTPYTGLARTYYQQQQDQQAVKILNRYIKLAAEHNIGSKDIQKLKQKINHGQIRRFNNQISS